MASPKFKQEAVTISAIMRRASGRSKPSFRRIVGVGGSAMGDAKRSFGLGLGYAVQIEDRPRHLTLPFSFDNKDHILGRKGKDVER